MNILTRIVALGGAGIISSYTCYSMGEGKGGGGGGYFQGFIINIQFFNHFFLKD